MKKAQDYKVNDFVTRNENIFKIVNVTKTRIIFVNTKSPDRKTVMGFNQFNYWFCK